MIYRKRLQLILIEVKLTIMFNINTFNTEQLRGISYNKTSVEIEMSKSPETKLPVSKSGLGSNHDDAVLFISTYFRIVSLVFVVWLTGYFNFSVSWLLLFVFLYMLKAKSMSLQEMKANLASSLNRNEKEAVLARLDDLPSWINFPDKVRESL